MTLDPAIRAGLTIPAVCAPMFLVSGPDLVREACKAGVIGALPRHNARTIEQFESWLRQIRAGLDRHRAAHPDARIGPIAVNLSVAMDFAELARNLDICGRYGVEIILSAVGNPAPLVRHVHDTGGKVFHDVTSMAHAEKAIAAGVDGLTCIGAGGGGHSGNLSHLTFIPRVREIFDGTIIMAGAISTGAGIRAAEVLGADLAYLGTRFIATQEAVADDAYKSLLVSQTSSELRYTPELTGVAANWLVESMAAAGLDPDHLPPPRGPMRQDHLPAGVRPWKNVWSAGQGIDLIGDLPSVAELVDRLREEYVAACVPPSMESAARR